MRKLLLLALLLASTKVQAGVTTTQVIQTLTKYCVPKPNDPAPDGHLTCGGVFEGMYNKGQSCSCASSGDTTFKHLVWDESLRRCKPKCPTGYFVNHIKNKTKCAEGEFKLKIVRK